MEGPVINYVKKILVIMLFLTRTNSFKRQDVFDFVLNLLRVRNVNSEV